MKIAIVGAGVTGLSAAHYLQKEGHELTIFEKESIPGGLARGFKEPHWQDSVEMFYHHWFKTDSAMHEVMVDLGLSDQVHFKKPKSVMFDRGKFYPFDSIFAALAYPGLGFGWNKIRFGLVGVYLRLTNQWQAMEKVTAAEWMKKYAGEKVYREMWEPMMVGKFGEEYANQVNMAWLWARIHSRTTELGTFEGGFQAFFDRFVEILKEKGVAFRFNETVQHISPDLVIQSSNGIEKFDKIIVTTSPRSLSKISPELPAPYRAQLDGLTSMGAVVMVISLKHPLSPQGYYWYNLPKNEGYPCLALVEHTNFVPKERYGGETILYAGDYLPVGHPHFELSNEELLQKMLSGLKKINPNFQPDWVIKSWKFSADYAQPVPFVNQSENIPPLQTPYSGMFLASMSQVYPWDRGTNYAFAMGKSLSRVILS